MRPERSSNAIECVELHTDMKKPPGGGLLICVTSRGTPAAYQPRSPNSLRLCCAMAIGRESAEYELTSPSIGHNPIYVQALI